MGAGTILKLGALTILLAVTVSQERPAAEPKGRLPGPELRGLLGVNLAGAESASRAMPGRLGYNYRYPTTRDVDMAYRMGVRLFRIPIREDRIQDGFNGPLRPETRSSLYPLVDHILGKRDAVAILDWHSFGKRQGSVYGTTPWDVAAIVDINRKLLQPYGGNARVWLDLQNEPVGAGAGWWPTAQAVVTALREAGISNTLLISGEGYSAARSWPARNGLAARSFEDPENNVIFEPHTYFDARGGGTDGACVAGAEERLRPAIRHAEKNGYRILIGELAVGDSPVCDEVRRNAVRLLKSSRNVVGATWWAMGDFYLYPRYPFGLSGPDKDRPSILLQRLSEIWSRS